MIYQNVLFSSQEIFSLSRNEYSLRLRWNNFTNLGLQNRTLILIPNLLWMVWREKRWPRSVIPLGYSFVWWAYKLECLLCLVGFLQTGPFTTANVTKTNVIWRTANYHIKIEENEHWIFIRTSKSIITVTEYSIVLCPASFFPGSILHSTSNPNQNMFYP